MNAWQDDTTGNLLSPNPEEERQFFERLIQEDNVGIDHELALDDPDNYLLRSGANDMVRLSSRFSISDIAV